MQKTCGESVLAPHSTSLKYSGFLPLGHVIAPHASPPPRPSGFSSSPLISRTVNGLNLAGEWLIPSRLHLPTSSKGDVVHLFLSESEQTSTSLLQLGRSSLSEPRVAQLWISNQPMGSRDPGEGGGHLQFNPILISSRVVSSLSAARARG